MPSSRNQKIGVLYALAAFGFWGVIPVYFKAIQDVPPLEILAHRVIWSVLFTAMLVTFGRDWKALKVSLAAKGVLRTLFLSAILIAANWFVFLYAIITDRVLHASMGYFINPLINVVLGMVFLRERLRVWQALAVMLASAGTFYLTISHGRLPWISLFLGFSFGFYGLLRKNVGIESLNGLFVETSLIFPFALLFLMVQMVEGKAFFGVINWQTNILLASAGAVTSLPLVWFTSAVRRLRYTTIGVLQYIGPSLQFLLAVFLYGEPFTHVHLVTFSFIWTGLAVFVAGSILWRSKAR